MITYLCLGKTVFCSDMVYIIRPIVEFFFGYLRELSRNGNDPLPDKPLKHCKDSNCSKVHFLRGLECYKTYIQSGIKSRMSIGSALSGQRCLKLISNVSNFKCFYQILEVHMI